MMATLMMNIVREKTANNASFFRYSMDAFQRRFVDIRMTCVSLDVAFNFQLRCTLTLTEAIC